MKLASLNKGRDGQLIVVSKDLQWFADAASIAPTLQYALDHWSSTEAPLRALSDKLNEGAVFRQRLYERDLGAPLPRAYQWVDASAFVNHVDLVRRARGADMPDSFWVDPLMYQGASCEMLAPHAPIYIGNEDWGADFEGEIIVVTNDIAIGTTADTALDHILLIGLVNDVSLRNLIPAELAKGFGFVQSKPASALSPILVTPDELGEMWQDGKLHGQLNVDMNDRPFGRVRADVDMTFHFGTLIAHVAKTRNLVAGSVIGSGTVSNRGADGGPGKTIQGGGVGYSCIAEVRTVETLNDGKPNTAYLQSGDRVRIWMDDENGQSIFGDIHQIATDTLPAMGA